MNTLVQQATAGNGGQGQGTSLFDQLRHVRPDGTEFWSARELMGPMGYGADWRNFRSAITRAEVSASAQGFNPQDLFVGVTEKSSGRPREDVHLVRFAAYLVAMNGDPRKREIAAAQAYFAVRTREAETARPVASVETMLSDPDTMIQLLTAYKVKMEALTQAEQQARALEAQIEADAPATELGRALDDAGALSLKDAAGAVQQRMRDAGHDGFSLGRTRLVKRLVDLGLVYRRGQDIVPYQRALEAGWLRAVSTTYTTSQGERVRWTVRVTAKGVDHLVKRLAPAGGGAGE